MGSILECNNAERHEMDTLVLCNCKQLRDQPIQSAVHTTEEDGRFRLGAGRNTRSQTTRICIHGLRRHSASTNAWRYRLQFMQLHVPCPYARIFAVRVRHFLICSPGGDLLPGPARSDRTHDLRSRIAMLVVRSVNCVRRLHARTSEHRTDLLVNRQILTLQVHGHFLFWDKGPIERCQTKRLTCYGSLPHSWSRV